MNDFKMQVLSLPEFVQSFIDRYFNLRIGNQRVRCPYFINSDRFLSSPVWAGKGTPDEIEKLVRIYVDSTMDEVQIRNVMINKGIGIDCSGFIYNVYDFWIRRWSNDMKSLSDFLPPVSLFNVRKYFSRRLKPQSSVSADELTSLPFASRLEVSKVLPGDLIRTKGGRHVLLISKVFVRKHQILKIHFVHSAREYIQNGVREGIIEFGDDLSLSTAEWIDIPAEEVNHAFLGFKYAINSNGIFRPNLPILGNR